MADQQEPEKVVEEKAVAKSNTGGVVLFCGASDFYGAGGRSKESREDYPNIPAPHQLKSLQGIKVAFVAGGSAANHFLIGDINGVAYTWGRGEKGQLGHNDQVTRNVPTVLESLKDVKIVGGACGKSHTVMITASGESYTTGSNSYGQCGTGQVKKAKKGVSDDMYFTPQLALISKCSAVSCGADFTIWLCDGKLWSCGLAEFGQTGHGTDFQYNSSDSSIKMVFDPQPTPHMIVTLGNKNVTRIACGHTHAIAVCDDGGVWTWGNGGYGRLGHKVQKDEMVPRLVETLSGRVAVPADAIVAAGQTSSFCSTVGGQLFAWGKLKTSGDATMYPNPLYDLTGWDITNMKCGATTFIASAISQEDGQHSLITWGQAQHQELGYGEGGKKSSANPDKCLALEGVDIYGVAMGNGHTLILADPEHEKVKNAPVWEPKEPTDSTAPKPLAPGAKRKGPLAGAAAKKAKAAAEAAAAAADAE